MSYLVFPRVRVQAANMLSASFLMGGPPVFAAYGLGEALCFHLGGGAKVTGMALIHHKPRGAGAIFLRRLFATATASRRVHVRQVGQRQRLLFEKTPHALFFAARGLCPSAREHHLGTGTGGGRDGGP